jgi:hypothetical protein
MDQRACSKRVAEAAMVETDNGRNDFIRRYFHRDVTEAQLYDCVVNLAQLSRSDAVELIVTCHRLRLASCGQ